MNNVVTFDCIISLGAITDRFLDTAITDRFLDTAITDRFLDTAITDRFLGHSDH